MQWFRTRLRPYWRPEPQAEELSEVFCRADVRRKELNVRVANLRRQRDLIARRGEHSVT
jgi:hypothetical protein